MGVLYLSHHGILGQKWGVRRYQNKDGTLTAIGKRRLKEVDNPDKVNSKILGEVSKDYRKVSSIQNSGANISRTASNMAKEKEKERKEKYKQSIDVSKMSNKELQDAVARMNLERNYKQLVTDNVYAGKKYISDYLSIAGDIFAVGASAATIASVLYEIRK